MKLAYLRLWKFWSVLFLFQILNGCRPSEFREPTSVAAQAAINKESSSKNFGGPFNFGIKFDPVDPSRAKDFWGSWKDPNSFTVKTLKSIGPLRPEAFGEILLFSDFKNEKIKGQALSLAREWYKAAGKWAQLTCQHIDMEAAFRGELKASPKVVMSRGEPACFLKGREGKEMPPEAGWNPSSRWSVSPERKPNPKLLGDFNEEWAPDTGVGVLLDKTIPGGYILQITPDIEWEGNRGFNLLPGSFFIVGNYFIPAGSWGRSKSFAIPVMEFESNPDSPNFLKPKGWFDYGLLVLQGLPEDGNILVSRTGDSLANSFGDPEKRKGAGFLMNLLPPERVDTFVPPEEALGKDFFNDGNMERMPAGSMHFTANTAWAQMGRGLNRYVYLKNVKREELVSLYLAKDKTRGSVWVNSLDRINFTEKGPSEKEVHAALVDGKCEIMKRNTGNTPGFFMETEIILGMQSGRALLASERAGVSACINLDLRE